MKVLCVFGKHGYGDPRNSLSTEYASFIPALDRLGHQVLHFESWDKTTYHNYSDLNSSLLSCIGHFQPHVVFTVQRDYEIWLDTLAVIKSRWPQVVTATWTTDDSWKFREVSRFIAPAYDAITTTYAYRLPDYHRCGVHSVLLTQWAANSWALRAPRPARDCDIAVSFIGAAYGERPELVKKLRRAGVAVQCFGSGWPSGPVAGECFADIINTSAISLNFSGASKALTYPQIKARTFEVPGAGSLLLTQDAIDLDRHYLIGKEIDTFTHENLVHKVQKYLAAPDLRDQIAWAGYSRTLRDHTYEHRLKNMLDFARGMGTGNTDDCSFVATLAKAEHAHRVTPALHCLRKILMMTSRLLYGSERAPRAARRAMFEISWRFAGRQTFTASGLPGRLFPNT